LFLTTQSFEEKIEMKKSGRAEEQKKINRIRRENEYRLPTQ
jgi:hypothetical protein